MNLKKSVVMMSLSVLVGVGLFSVWVNSSQAEEPTRVRVVFAVDDSGSMYDSSNWQGADPYKKRYEGIRNVVRVVRALMEEKPFIPVEIGMLRFGDVVVASASPRPIEDSSLDALLVSTTFESLRWTDHLAALCSGWAITTGETPPLSSNCPPVASAGTVSSSDTDMYLVVITDGLPTKPMGGQSEASDSRPSATECLSGDLVLDPESTDPDEYLCALATTWRALTQQIGVELIVIGLDETGKMWSASEPYWKAITRCDQPGHRACGERVFRSVNADELSDIILRAMPFIRSCDGDDCGIVGGLTDIRIRVTGTTNQSETTVRINGEDYSSVNAPSELTIGSDFHEWNFIAPKTGVYEVVHPSDTHILYAVPTPAEFIITPVEWNDATLSIGLESIDEVHVPSLESQAYFLMVERDGDVVREEEVNVQHVQGSEFSLIIDMPRPEFDSNSRYELILYHPSFEQAVANHVVTELIPGGITDEEKMNAVCANVSHDWVGRESAKSKELGFAWGFPLLQFAVPTDWDITFSADGCEHDFAVAAEFGDCSTCADEDFGTLPLTLSLSDPEVTSDGVTKLLLEWQDYDLGTLEYPEIEVRIVNGVLIQTEPIWRLLLHLIVLGLLFTGVSAISVRSRTDLSNGMKEAPVKVGLIDQLGRVSGLVTAGLYVSKAVPLSAENADFEGCSVSLRYLVAGPLVLRGGKNNYGILGKPVKETHLVLNRLTTEKAHSSSPL